MRDPDPFPARPTLTHPGLLATALDRLRGSAACRAEIWRLLTERYVVDLDAVAHLLPCDEPEPVWLPVRG